MNQRFVIFSN